MRIRTFTADNAREAIDVVRVEMGDDAVIISLDETANGRGVIVRAALEGDDEDAPLPEVGKAAAGPAAPEERLERMLLARLNAWPAERTALALA